MFIHNSVDKNQQTTLRCSLEPIVDARLIEIPHWMFDAVSLCGVRRADTPTVSGEALLELKALLSSLGKQRDERVLQAQHPSLARTGETDAKVIKPPRMAQLKLFHPPRLATNTQRLRAQQSSRRVRQASQCEQKHGF